MYEDQVDQGFGRVMQETQPEGSTGTLLSITIVAGVLFPRSATCEPLLEGQGRSRNCLCLGVFRLRSGRFRWCGRVVGSRGILDVDFVGLAPVTNTYYVISRRARGNTY